VPDQSPTEIERIFTKGVFINVRVAGLIEAKNLRGTYRWFSRIPSSCASPRIKRNYTFAGAVIVLLLLAGTIAAIDFPVRNAGALHADLSAAGVSARMQARN
jgi:hypothetical protein